MYRSVSVIFAGSLAIGIPNAHAYLPTPGYLATGTLFTAESFAFGPGGQVAVGSDNFLGGASISVYASLADVGGVPTRTFTDPSWKFFGGIDFADATTVVFGENGSTAAVDAVYRGSILSGDVLTLSNVPNVGDVDVEGSSVYVAAQNGPGANDVVRLPLAGGASTLLVENFGTGYGGGVLVAGGKIYATETNDPFFEGNAGNVHVFDLAGAFEMLILLTRGGGSGAVGLSAGFDGDIFVATGNSISRIDINTSSVTPFGQFTGPFAFPTTIDFSGNRLFVNGIYTETGGTFAVSVPEPAGMVAIVVGSLALLRRRGGVR